MDSLFKPVLDISEGDFTANQVQGVFGMFVPVLDDAQGAAGSEYSKIFNETIAIVDILSAAKVTAKIISETITVVDTITRSFTRSLSEVVTVVDTILKAFPIAFSEVVTVTDTIAKSISRAFSEVVTVVDTISKLPGKVLSEVTTIVDSITSAVPGVKNLTEQISLTDSINLLFNSLTGGIQKLLNNPIRDFFTKKIGGVVQPQNKPSGRGVTDTDKPQGR